MDGLQWKTLLKLMIWGYPYFWKHPNISRELEDEGLVFWSKVEHSFSWVTMCQSLSWHKLNLEVTCTKI